MLGDCAATQCCPPILPPAKLGAHDVNSTCSQPCIQPVLSIQIETNLADCLTRGGQHSVSTNEQVPDCAHRVKYLNAVMLSNLMTNDSAKHRQVGMTWLQVVPAHLGHVLPSNLTPTAPPNPAKGESKALAAAARPLGDRSQQQPSKSVKPHPDNGCGGTDYKMDAQPTIRVQAWSDVACECGTSKPALGPCAPAAAPRR